MKPKGNDFYDHHPSEERQKTGIPFSRFVMPDYDITVNQPCRYHDETYQTDPPENSEQLGNHAKKESRDEVPHARLGNRALVNCVNQSIRL